MQKKSNKNSPIEDMSWTLSRKTKTSRIEQQNDLRYEEYEHDDMWHTICRIYLTYDMFYS